jgi:hypothetical protein
VGHEDHGLGTVVDGILDGGDGASNALGVGDLLVGIEGNVEIDLCCGRLVSDGVRDLGSLDK